jgi:hypothetical protein
MKVLNDLVVGTRRSVWFLRDEWMSGVSDCDGCIEIDVFGYLRVYTMCNLRKGCRMVQPSGGRDRKSWL